MRPAGRRKLAQTLTYECARCGDEYPFASGDDVSLVKVHALLHLAADYRLATGTGHLLERPARAGGVAMD
jgi:hypothetical protein